MATFHVRSISLPSRSHPLAVSIEEQLSKLKASQNLSVGRKLSGLKYSSHGSQNQCVEDALNGSLQILDVCNTAREFYLQVKESAKELELSLRRRKGDSSLTAEVKTYMVSRKKLNKVICKCLRNLRRKDKKYTTTSLENNSNLTNIVGILGQLENVSIAVFESILCFISQTPKSKGYGWSAVSKLLHSKPASYDGEEEANEMEKIEKQLLVLISSKEIKSEQVQNVVK